MKKILLLLAMGIIINVATAGIEENKVSSNIGIEEIKKNFEIIEGEKYINIYIEGANYLHYEGKPMLPYYTKIYTFPLGTRVSVKCIPKNVEEIEISKKIMPAMPPIPLNGGKYEIEENESIYKSNALYPDEWYSYNLYGGLVDGKRSTILSLHLYPIRYRPLSNKLIYADDFEIKIEYDLPSQTIEKDEYDLLIITADEFYDEVVSLKEHKESHGIKTIIAKVEDIYSSYSGRDGAEKVKYFIKDAIEKYGIKYVLLIGGKKSYLVGNWGMDGPAKSNDALWYVPVRYVALNDMEEGGYISDLYSADIYDANGNFSSWDTNGNGIYGEWWLKGRDRDIDFVPDVYVGRLACRSIKEVRNVINKIIKYENEGNTAFNKMLLVGGDTFDDPEEVCEGEVSTLYFYKNYMNSFEKTSLFVSDGSLTYGVVEPNNIAGRFAWINVIKEFSKGFGFVVFDGHGSPTAWATHFKGAASHKDPWVNGLMTYNMDLLQNKYKLPVVIIRGCHNSEFNISLLDDIKNPWTYQPTYECFSWHLVKMADRGAIATIGNTGLGYGAVGGDANKNGVPDCVEFNGGYIEDRFFNAYGVKGKDMLGETWATAITDYILTYPPMKDRIDCKTIEEWVLLGDPSLKIGGY